MKKINYLYIYDEDSGEFTLKTNLIFEKLTFGENTLNSEDHYFAVDPAKRFRKEVGGKQGEVFHDYDTHKYYIWLDGPDNTRAIESIKNYINKSTKNFIAAYTKLIEKEKKRAKLAEEFYNNQISINQ